MEAVGQFAAQVLDVCLLRLADDAWSIHGLRISSGKNGGQALSLSRVTMVNASYVGQQSRATRLTFRNVTEP